MLRRNYVILSGTRKESRPFLSFVTRSFAAELGHESLSSDRVGRATCVTTDVAGVSAAATSGFSSHVAQKETHSSAPLPISTPCVPTYTRGHISARCLVDIPTAVVLCTGRRHPANLVTPVYPSVMQMSVTIAFLWRRPCPARHGR